MNLREQRKERQLKRELTYITFEEAREYARTLNIRFAYQWVCIYDRPQNIPDEPNIYYKDKGWVSWKDFLGFEFIDLKTLKKIVRENKIKSAIGYFAFRKQNPHLHLPSNPETYYNKQNVN
jgi:hypothetical protein